MEKTNEAAWREGFLKPETLVAPKINDLYGRKSAHIVDRIQRMLKINEIAIVAVHQSYGYCSQPAAFPIRGRSYGCS